MSDYRQLTAAEFAQFHALDSYAFKQQYHLGRYTPEVVAQLRGLFVGGEHVAQLQIMPFQLQAGLGELAVAGIGSVAVWPQHRRRGHADQILRHACAEIAERGAALALLYPFRHSFYGRLGWAGAGERRRLRPTPAQLRGFAHAPGGFTPAGADQIDELDAIYRAALRGRFGPLARDRWWWREDVLRTWGGEPHRAFIWRDEAGRGRAYLIFRIDAGERGDRLVCRDIVALDPVARGQLFAFIADHAAQVGDAELHTPIDAPVGALLADPPPTEAVPIFMQRPLDVAALLAVYPFAPEASGRLTIQVADGWLAHNGGRYQIELAAGRATVARLGPGDADLACAVGTLGQLLSRFLRPRTAAAFGLLEAPGRPALALLETALAGLPPFCADYF